MYSQHNEEEIILKYFGDKKDGRFLDVGAYNGVVFSNTRRLYELGWGGTLVEASPKVFVGLQEAYPEDPKIELVCAAISRQDGCSRFYDNQGAVASLSKEHMEKWNKPQNFVPINVATITPLKLLQNLPGPYDFMSYDIEGVTIAVLGLFPPFKEMGLKMICIEAENQGEKDEVQRIMEPQGYTFLISTVLNVFYVESK